MIYIVSNLELLVQSAHETCNWKEIDAYMLLKMQCSNKNKIHFLILNIINYLY